MEHIKFISFDGKYPASLGKLILEIDGVIVDSVKIESSIPCYCGMLDKDCNAEKYEVYTIPEEYENLIDEIETVVNKNLSKNCENCL